MGTLLLPSCKLQRGFRVRVGGRVSLRLGARVRVRVSNQVLENPNRLHRKLKRERQKNRQVVDTRTPSSRKHSTLVQSQRAQCSRHRSARAAEHKERSKKRSNGRRSLGSSKRTQGTCSLAVTSEQCAGKRQTRKRADRAKEKKEANSLGERGCVDAKEGNNAYLDLNGGECNPLLSFESFDVSAEAAHASSLGPVFAVVFGPARHSPVKRHVRHKEVAQKSH